MELLTPDQIVRLSPPERIALIAQLWDSLDEGHLPLTEAQQLELECRLTSLDQDRQNAIPWTALKAELEQRQPVVFTIAFTQAARAELIEAQDWYAGETVGLGRRFRHAIDVVTEDETVLVISCFHAGRDPLRWQRRA